MIAYPLEISRENGALPAGIGFSFGSNYEDAQRKRFSFLHPDEEKVWDGFKYPRRRKSYLLGREAAKAALSICFPIIPANRIEIVNGVLGQPWLKAAAGIEAEFSLSHAENAAAAVACQAGHPMGVDVELLDAERAAVAQSCITPEETALVAGLALPGTAAALLLWSMREALAKVLRCGLTVPFVLLASEAIRELDGSYGAQFRNFPQYRAQSWIIGGYVLSIALPRRSSLRFAIPDDLRRRFEAAAGEAAATAPNLRQN